MTRNDTIAFLTCVLPAEGLYCAVIFDNAKPRAGIDKPRHQFFNTIAELADALLAADQAGCAAYHAIASFTTPRRIQANALGARSLIADVDAGAGKPYATAADAARAAVLFCYDARLPRAVLVGSGSGVHCYWPFAKTLDPAQWLMYSTSLKALCHQHGLKIDPARTADIASILRPPGTHNRKIGEILVEYDPGTLAQTDISQFEALRQAHPAAAPRSAQRHGSGLIGRMWSAPSFDTVYADPIADQCGQLAALRKSGNLPEPQWYACLGVLAYCTDGEIKAHEWSKRDFPNYSDAETTAKINQTRQLTGATTCGRFHAIDPAVCERCPLYGQINSPIAIRPAVREQSEAGPGPTVGGVTLPVNLGIFCWGSKGQLLAATENKNGVGHNIVISEHPIYLDGVQTAELDRSTFNYRFRRYLPQEGWSDIVIDAKLLHGSNGVAEMIGKGAVIRDPKLFLNYVKDAVDHFHKKQKTNMRYDQFGWKNDDQSFLYGEMLYTAAGPVTAIGAKEVEIRSQWLGPRKGGSLQAWTEAADSLFGADMEAYSAMVLASFAAVLMRFQSTDEGGCIIHLFTPGTGHGKSMALAGAFTVWGTKDGLSLTNEDTRVSKPIVMGALGNLPIIYDELRDKDPEYIRKMVMMFSEGRDRMRGMMDGTIRHLKANWQTLFLSASNYSLLDQLAGESVDAPSYRALELASELPPSLDKNKGDRLKRILITNAGHAGDAYLRYLVNPEVLSYTRAALEQWTKDIYEMTGLSTAHRFRVRAIAAIAVAGKIVDHLGIVHFEVNRIIDWLIKDLQSKRYEGPVSSSPAIENALSQFGEFVNEHYGETLIVRDQYKSRTAPVGVIQRPHNRLCARFEVEPKKLFISATVFREWTLKRGISQRTILDPLEKHGVIVTRNRMFTLSAGTDIPGAQIRCIEADARHPAMGSIVAAVVNRPDQSTEEGSPPSR